MKPFVRLLLLFSIKTNAQRVQITGPFDFQFGSLRSSTPTSTLIATSSTSNTVIYTSISSSTPSTNIYNWQETSSFQVASVTSPLVTTVVTVVGLSSSTPSPQPTQSTSTSFSTTSSSEKSPRVGIILGVVVGAIVLVLLLFLYIRRRINRRAQELNENSNPKPFLLLPKPTLNLTSVPSFIPQLFSSKFSRRRESANALTTASGSGSSRPTSCPVSGVRIDPINSAIQNTKTIGALQPSTTAQGGDPEFLQHARSGVRMPHAEGNLEELPPAYTIS